VVGTQFGRRREPHCADSSVGLPTPICDALAAPPTPATTSGRARALELGESRHDRAHQLGAEVKAQSGLRQHADAEHGFRAAQRSINKYRCKFHLKAAFGIFTLFSPYSCVLTHYAALPLTVPDLATRITCPNSARETSRCAALTAPNLDEATRMRCNEGDHGVAPLSSRQRIAYCPTAKRA
jgi:hypothetical protein